MDAMSRPTTTKPAARPRRDVITLPAAELPTRWYNVLPDLPAPLAPPRSPATGQPVTPDELGRIFPPQVIEQEMSRERFIAIPEEVLDILARWRPTPLVRARRLEAALGTPARIYYKHEGVSPTGSHKPNTAVPQAYFNKQHGIRRLTTETGAGQWGSALAFATRMFGMTCRVLHGARELRPEAVPAHVHAPVRRGGVSQPVAAHRLGAGDPGERPRLPRQPGHRDQRGGRGGGRPPRHQLRPRQRAQPRPPAPDGDRPGGEAAARDGGRFPGLHFRVPRRRLQLRRPGAPVRPRDHGGRADPRDRGRAGRLPEPDARPLRVRLRRHREAHADGPHVHART